MDLFSASLTIIIVSIIVIFLILLFGDIEDQVQFLPIPIFFAVIFFLIAVFAKIEKDSKFKNEKTKIENEKTYEQGYRRGQIDCQNDSLLYIKVMNDDGEVVFVKKNY